MLAVILFIKSIFFIWVFAPGKVYWHLLREWWVFAGGGGYKIRVKVVLRVYGVELKFYW